MTKTFAFAIAGLVAISGCISEEDTEDTKTIGVAEQQLSAPPGMGRYCSMS
jgi:hypothetical protein